MIQNDIHFLPESSKKNKKMESILQTIKEYMTLWNQRESFVETIYNFIDAIEWEKDKWILYVFGFWLLYSGLLFLTRQRQNIHAVFFVVHLSGVLLAERLNNYLSSKWEQFSSQNYFDSQGVFISVVWSGPILLLSCFMLINWFYQTYLLMIQVKRAQIQRKQKSQKVE